MSDKISVFWFRRDLRIEDNTALHYALKSGKRVLPIFIFDKKILNELDNDDARVTFIHKTLSDINASLKKHNGGVFCLHTTPEDAWKKLTEDYTIENVFFNKDYEPYAKDRDSKIISFLEEKNINVSVYKDSVIFEENDVLKNDGDPYTVYTPFKNKWKSLFKPSLIEEKVCDFKDNLLKIDHSFPSLEDLGFTTSSIEVQPYNLDHLSIYADKRDFPSDDITTYLGPHLRFGTVSVRKLIRGLDGLESVFLSELVWREFFTQILYHFPKVVTQNFRSKYDGIKWRNNKDDFEKWCSGNTGYPMVDAGMRQLNQTGYMHNRVRMITAGFLCKHLLIDWQWGEAYFAKKLLDYELASNNGNWQWAAGTGCDAAPYFRIFNPITQLKKFDKDFKYVRQWIPELDGFNYPEPMVEHKSARERALKVYKEGIEN
ncbi:MULTISPECIES: cryptochrome/photolyase family protein [unclassified Cellulophaga]|uniref:cryptochrome/photolyase family protein n=1 Tax=unclassified Cellulophaga TaxID=2634405 RepID=UPI0026E3FB4E|nr:MULTISPECIES: deoxyribodipyrimidine photo-lyase [unclassified Cellulophaga]MDO6492665.1 deoxyribodipyrimidine photo-lyase [Cellulophaga sp. 2_MG-2023]MDO6495922.1 deoxyribodipyrimidine photo-lyase [Cellulophaga sp. 3_MG-2023]